MSVFSDRQLGALVAAALVGLWYFRGRLDEAFKGWTRPAGALLSDATAWANGNERLTFTPLVLQPGYFADDWSMTAEAYRVLVKAYPRELAELLTPGGVLKPEYRGLVGSPFTLK